MNTYTFEETKKLLSHCETLIIGDECYDIEKVHEDEVEVLELKTRRMFYIDIKDVHLERPDVLLYKNVLINGNVKYDPEEFTKQNEEYLIENDPDLKYLLSKRFIVY